jgi:archaellum component FlaF (FlaF/FlaG flagellin family)
MGFSVSVSSVIFFSAFILLSGIVIGVGLDYQRTVDRAKEERNELEMSRELAEFSLISWIMDDDDLVLYLENTGDVRVELEKMKVLVNGDFKNNFSMEIDGSVPEILFEDEILTLRISDVDLNTSSVGGNLLFTSSYHFNSPGRISSDSWIYVSDGTEVVTLDENGDLEWVKGTSLTSIDDICTINGTILVLGDDKVLSCPKNGSSVFSDLIASTPEDSIRMISSEVSGSEPYIIILDEDGNVTRYNSDGTDPTTICVNGTNVNWTSPVDLLSGNGSFYVLDYDGSIFEVYHNGTDLKAGEFVIEGEENVIAGTSCGSGCNQVIAIISKDYSDRLVVFDITNSTQFDVTDSLGGGKTDLDIGSGIFVLDPLDGRVEAYEIGTTVKLTTIFGFSHLEVI